MKLPALEMEKARSINEAPVLQKPTRYHRLRLFTGIACLTIFPLIYLLGRLIMHWFG